MRVTILCIMLLLLPTFASTCFTDEKENPYKKYVIGKWSATDKDGDTGQMEFNDKGEVVLKVQKITIKGTYKFVKKDEIHLALKLPNQSERIVKFKIKSMDKDKFEWEEEKTGKLTGKKLPLKK